MSASTSGQNSSWSEPNTPPGVDPPGTPTHYDVLGVPYSASGADIARAYREAMRRSHPDHQSRASRPDAEERAKQINAAYAILSKPARRLAYDRTIRHQVVQDQIMSRYVGGFDSAMADARSDQRDLWHAPTAAERREQALSDRHALISLLIVFGGITGAVLTGLLLWSILSALASLVF